MRDEGSTSCAARQVSPIEEGLEDYRRGKMVILVDDEDRENEGDLVIAAGFVEADHINTFGSLYLFTNDDLIWIAPSHLQSHSEGIVICNRNPIDAPRPSPRQNRLWVGQTVPRPPSV